MLEEELSRCPDYPELKILTPNCATEDPFRFDIDIGVSVAAKSRPNEHLTWGILSSTLRGLQECLFPNDWYEEVVFKIFDSAWGPVGDGSVMGYERTVDLRGGMRINRLLDHEET